MSGALAEGLLLGVASAGAIGGGFALQHRGAAGLPPLSIRRPVRSLALLAKARVWVAGSAFGLAGWAAYILALRLAPLSLVQAASAGGIVVLVLAGGRPSRMEGLGAAAALAGLVLLGLSLSNGTTGGAAAASALVLWLGLSGVGAAVAAAAAARGIVDGAGLGVAAGILYAAADVATKEAVGGGARLLLIPLVLLASGLAFTALQLGFQRGGRMATAGVATLWTNALPIVAGTVVFQEHFPSGASGAERIAAFTVLVSAAAVLARTGLHESSAAEAAARGVGEARFPGYRLTD
jgi:hypothetical protein